MTPVILAVGLSLIDVSATTNCRLIATNQTWSSVYAGAYVVALLFRRHCRHLATAAGVWLSKPVLLLFALQFYTVGIAINRYVFAVDSLRSLLLVSASAAAVGHLSAFCNKFAVRRRSLCRRHGGVVIVGQKLAPTGADLAALNCLLAVAVLRLALDQPDADLASAVPIWLLILHPLLLMWYWMATNIRRYYRKKRGEFAFRHSNNGCCGKFGFARKFLRVSVGRTTDSYVCDDVMQLRTVERITVV